MSLLSLLALFVAPAEAAEWTPSLDVHGLPVADALGDAPAGADLVGLGQSPAIQLRPDAEASSIRVRLAADPRVDSGWAPVHVRVLLALNPVDGAPSYDHSIAFDGAQGTVTYGANAELDADWCGDAAEKRVTVDAGAAVVAVEPAPMAGAPEAVWLVLTAPEALVPLRGYNPQRDAVVAGTALVGPRLDGDLAGLACEQPWSDLFARDSHDRDGDGLSDWDERQVHGTDADAIDTDRDWLGDAEEVLGPDGIPHSGDETLPGDADSDDDRLSDGLERVGMDRTPDTGDETDPRRRDTDGDGLNDGVEVLGVDGVRGTEDDSDPNAVDTDRDGADDRLEVAGADGFFGTGDETSPSRPDTDGDGLLDGEELHVYGTDPLAWDSDGGHTSDGAEVLAHGTDPLDPADDLDSNDSDGDGLTDADELAQGTDPARADTDGDGLSDAFEVEQGTDPLARDSDADGLSDGAERAAGTDPLRADSDSDGLADGEEAALGTDPLDADSDGDLAVDGAEVAAGTDPLRAPVERVEAPATGCSVVPGPGASWLLAGAPLLLALRRRRR